MRRAWRQVRHRPASAVGAAVVLLFVAMAIGAPWIATVDPLQTDWKQVRKAPTLAHPFGTDDLGRDTFSRVIWGSRISTQAGVFSILLAITVGVPIGLVAGYYRSGLDQVIMRLTDAWLAFPFLILAIGLITILPPAPSWGTMLNTAQQFLDTAPWMAWWPGLAIFSLTLSFNLAGDGLRDLLDPRDY